MKMPRRLFRSRLPLAILCLLGVMGAGCSRQSAESTAPPSPAPAQTLSAQDMLNTLQSMSANDRRVYLRQHAAQVQRAMTGANNQQRAALAGLMNGR